MYRLINLLCINLFGILQCAYAECTVDQFHKTPISKMANCDEFIRSDSVLNKSYKILLKELSSSQKDLLKYKQREWIKWRDKTCEEAQSKVYCPSPICEGEEHDSCVIELTGIRSRELTNLVSKAKSASDCDFDFKREYKQD